jgi:hypothetical protein
VFTLVMLGVRAEVDAWPTLLYTACLLPRAAGGGEGACVNPPPWRELHLVCVGPDVPASLDGAAAAFVGPAGGFAATTRLSFTRGRWHEVVAAKARPLHA